MEPFFSSGRIVELILGLVLLEALLLIVLRRWHGMSLVSVLGNLLAGACLLLALRVALVGADWRWLALALLGALLGHGLDIMGRLRDSV